MLRERQRAHALTRRREHGVRHDKRYAIRVNDEFTVDVMPSIVGLSWAEMMPHIAKVTIDGTPIRVLDLPGLLKTKQGVRPKDQMDAAVIAEALRRLGKDVNA